MLSGLTSLIVPAVSVVVTVLTVFCFCWANTPYGVIRTANANTIIMTFFINNSFIVFERYHLSMQINASPFPPRDRFGLIHKERKLLFMLDEPKKYAKI